MKDDTELLHLYATERSDPAFSELVRRHVDLVYSVALRKVGGDAHSAKDVAQAVFVALARQAASLTQRRTLAGWLYLTTHHLAAQSVRSDRRRQIRENQAQAMNEIFNTPETEWHQIRPMLDEAMRELNEPDREAILLRYFEQRPFAEIGRALRVTEDAARMRVDRALEKLRLLLVRRGVPSTAAALAAVLGHQVMAAPAGLAATIATTAAATTTSAGAIATFTGFFMNTTNIIASSIALTAMGTVVLQSNEARHTMEELAAVRQERTALQVQLDGAENRSAQASHQVAALQDELDAIRASTETVAATTNETKRMTTATIVTLDPVAEEHERKVSAEERQAQIDRTLTNYAPLFKKLALTEAQVNEFKALLTANLVREGDLREIARSQGIRPVDPDVQALETEAGKELANQIRTTFGDSTYQAFQYFNETGPMRELASHLTTALAPTTTPLSADQAEQLVEILANNSRTQEGRVTGNPQALNFDAAIAQAQTVLSPPQLVALRQVHASRD